MKLLRTVILLFAFGSLCPVQGQPTDKTWKSTVHPILIQYGEDWGLFAKKVDRPDRVRMLLMDQRDGSSFQLRLEEKHARLILTEDAYRQTLKDGLGGRIIGAEVVRLFNRDWYRIRGEILNEKWKTRMAVDISYCLIEGKLVLLQWAFPAEKVTLETELPKKLQRLLELSDVFGVETPKNLERPLSETAPRSKNQSRNDAEIRTTSIRRVRDNAPYLGGFRRAEALHGKLKRARSARSNSENSA